MVSECFGVVIYEVLIDFPNLGLAVPGLPETGRRLEARTRFLLRRGAGGPAGMGFTSVAGRGERRLWRRG